MKTELPPWVAAAIVVVIVLIVGAFFYFGTNPGRQAKEMEAAINASAAKAGTKTPAQMTGGLPGTAGPPGTQTK